MKSCQHFRNHYIEIGREVNKLTKQYFPNAVVNFFAISCVPWKPICKDWNVHNYPAVFIFQDGSDKDGTKMEGYELHPFKILGKLGDIDIIEEEEDHTADKRKIRNGLNQHKDEQRHQENQQQQQQKQRHFLKRTKEDIYNDAYLSFDFAMRNAIFFNKGPLPADDKETFGYWIEQLKDALPPTWKLKRVVSEIFDNIEAVQNDETVLMEIMDKYPPKKKTWSKSCTRGDKYAGYTCGLWELFHIMTVGLVEWNTFASGGDDWVYYRPEGSAKVLRDYIEHFFGCEVCRVNFLHAYDTCEYDRCNRLEHGIGEMEDWKELPLWLFELHNGVNRRLLHERTERDNSVVSSHHDEVNVQWPPRDDCPICWHPDGRWDPDNIYNFLRLTYW